MSEQRTSVDQNPSVFGQIQHKTEWLAALRSGQYKQGRCRLKGANGGYCCLGVWAEVAGYIFDPELDGVIDPETGKGVSYDPIYEAFGGHDVCGLFVSMNDGLGFSFAEIADIAERPFATRDEASDFINNLRRETRS